MPSTELKTCKTCGSQLIKIKHESEARFQRKKYCSAKCSRVGLKKEKRGWWNPEFKQRFIEGGELL